MVNTVTETGGTAAVELCHADKREKPVGKPQDKRLAGA